MLNEVARGIFVHASDFMLSNAVVVQGEAGSLLIDPGIRAAELAGIASDLASRGLTVAAGFSTHPHWDHLLWHEGFGAPPRYGTARCAAAIAARLSQENWRASVLPMVPADIADEVPLDDLWGRITSLPDGAAEVPWAGPRVRIIEHQGHALGHAALVIDDLGVLVAGDMLSDRLVPILNFMSADPVSEYLAALQLLEDGAGDISVVIPGHGTVGKAGQFPDRLETDRAYVLALRDGREARDARLGASAEPGWEWVAELHSGQVQRLAQRAGGLG